MVQERAPTTVSDEKPEEEPRGSEREKEDDPENQTKSSEDGDSNDDSSDLEEDRKSQIRKKKKKCIAMAVLIVLLLAAVGAIVGRVLVDRPRSGIMAFLEAQDFPETDETSFEPGSFHAMAADWIIDEDPLQLYPEDDEERFVHRFALALFYFQATNGGKRQLSMWDDGDEIRWLTGTHECSWTSASIGCQQERVDALYLGG